ERHRERDGNRNRHQQRRAPLPKTDQSDDDDENDRFVKTLHKQVDTFFNLQRLVRRTRVDQVSGHLLPQTIEREINLFAKLRNLFTGSHLDRKRDRATALPVTITVAPVEEVLKTRRTLVTTNHIDEVAHVNHRAVRR